MSSRFRKPRPLDRDVQTYRDDRLYIVACDDTYAPKEYFDAYKKDFLGARLQIQVIQTEDGTSAAEHVLNRLLDYKADEQDQRWLLLDTDHYVKDSHRKSFLQALTRARQEGVHVAINKPCFEFWLLLHFLTRDDASLSAIHNAHSAAKQLKSLLGVYNKRKVDMAHFPLSTLSQAVLTAQEIDADVAGGDIPDSNTARTYLLWEEVIRNAAAAQLPAELRELKSKLNY